MRVLAGVRTRLRAVTFARARACVCLRACVCVCVFLGSCVRVYGWQAKRKSKKAARKWLWYSRAEAAFEVDFAAAVKRLVQALSSVRVVVLLLRSVGSLR